MLVRSGRPGRRGDIRGCARATDRSTGVDRGVARPGADAPPLPGRARERLRAPRDALAAQLARARHL